MKTAINTLLLLFAFSVGVAHAQRQQPNRQEEIAKIEQAKIAYLTQQLNLKTEQAEMFWPIYNEFSEKRRALHKERRQVKNIYTENLSDEDALKIIDQMIAVQEKEVALHKEYKTKFLSVISPQQLVELFKAEREFMRMLHKKSRERRGPEGRPAFEEEED